jgi:DNA uptake protein ComE-like DNA-binding protein
MSRTIKDSYLYFTRKERRGSLLLLILVVLVSLSPFLYSLLNPKQMTTSNEFDEQLASLKGTDVATQKSQNNGSDDDGHHYPEQNFRSPANDASSGIKGELFNFDPNTISPDDWRKLGLRDKTITTIQNYLAKGGKFRHPADIKKIWGLFPDEAERLIPYVQIVKAGKSENNYPQSNGPAKGKPDYMKTLQPITINESDAAVWIALPGIGPKLSERIVKFRDKLGGFYSVDQVAETFGLPDSIFQQIKPLLKVSGSIKKLNLNSASQDDLKNHPYIRQQLANAIVEFKAQHGDFKSISDIKKIMIVTEDLFNKLSPYLTVDDELN